VGRRRFYDPQRALTYEATVIDEALAKVEPLSAPVAGGLVVVVPTRDHVLRLLRLFNPRAEEVQLESLADHTLAIALMFVRALERRNAFAKVRTVRAEVPVGVDVPRDTYLIWFEYSATGTAHVHIAAAGEAKTTQLETRVGRGDQGWRSREVEQTYLGFLVEVSQAFIEAVEEYVAAHPPVGVTVR